MRLIKRSKGERKITKMSDEVTLEELKESLTEWTKKLKLVCETFSGASIEECIAILKAVKAAAKEKKEDEKPSMGFGSKGTKV